MLKQLSVNIHSVDSLNQMPKYAIFMKDDLVTKKTTISFYPTDNLHHHSAITSRFLVYNKEDPGALIFHALLKHLRLLRYYVIWERV